MEKLTTYDKEVLLRWFFYHIKPEERHALSREHPQAYNHYVGEEIVQVVGVSDNLAAYWTVIVHFTPETARDSWCPHESTGPFATISRGAFRTEEAASAWVDSHLPKGAKYEIKHIA